MTSKLFNESAASALTDALESGDSARRIFCDCDGTLFQAFVNDSLLGFNEMLFRFLVKLKQHGHDVVIFSGEAGSNEGRIKLFSQKITGDALFFADRNGFVVTPKTSVDGEEAYLVIDDDHRSHRLKATLQWEPGDSDVVDFIARAIAVIPKAAPEPGPA